MRIGMRRFTRLIKRLLKERGEPCPCRSLHFMYHNMARPHQTLSRRDGQPTTPPWLPEVADHVWWIWEGVGLLEST